MTDDPTNTGTPPSGDPTTQDPPKATDAGNPGTGDQIDFSKLSDDQLSKVLEDQRLWNTPRLKELRDKAKKADTLDAAEKKRQEDEALKKGEHEKVISDKQKRIEELEAQVSGSKIDNAITIAAQKAGAVDANAVLKLIDRTGISLGENGVAGVDEAIKALLDASPYLKGKAVTTVGNPTNPSGDDAAIREFKSSQLKDPKFFKENETEIMKAFRAGKIVKDD